MTASVRLVHEGCGSGHFTVDGADNNLRNALTIARHGVRRGQSRVLSVASRAGASLKARAECGLGHLRLATDGPGPGERQERRRHELESRSIRIFAERVSDTQVLSRQKRQRPEPLFA